MKLAWWEWLPVWPWRIAGVVDSADEVPEQLPARAIVMVKSGTRPKWLSFDCPCLTGHRIMLNIDNGRLPAWSIVGKRGRDLSIAPSVDYIEGFKRCHYVLQHGRVQWVGDSRR
jgi:uncharacterized protein DUF6527